MIDHIPFDIRNEYKQLNKVDSFIEEMKEKLHMDNSYEQSLAFKQD